MNISRRVSTIVFIFFCVFTGSAFAEESVKTQSECIEKGGTWDTGSGFKKEGYCILDTQKKCVSRGGIWARVCLSQSLVCLKKFSDGGKACSGSSDCEGGVCNAIGKEPDEKGLFVGECVHTSNPCGSFVPVEGGRTSHSIVYD